MACIIYSRCGAGAQGLCALFAIRSRAAIQREAPLSEQQLADMGEDAVKKAYARWAPVYDLTFGLIADSGRKRSVRHINTLPAGRILEVGVGTGMSLPLYRKDHRITGIDLSPEMLAKARERVRKERLDNVEAIIEMDAGAMSFDDDSFDVVIAMYVLTVVPDPQRVMRELERVCKPGGEVIVVNHFSQDKGIRGTVEKGMARFAEDLGWRPEFPKETVMVCDNLSLVDESPMKPFGLFTMMRFSKAPQPAIQAAATQA
jgi:phosphatidylethanolamine/phosphatidyl-N-methylethanolamine N-methyltransferase